MINIWARFVTRRINSADFAGLPSSLPVVKPFFVLLYLGVASSVRARMLPSAVVVRAVTAKAEGSANRNTRCTFFHNLVTSTCPLTFGWQSRPTSKCRVGFALENYMDRCLD